MAKPPQGTVIKSWRGHGSLLELVEGDLRDVWSVRLNGVLTGGWHRYKILAQQLYEDMVKALRRGER